MRRVRDLSRQDPQSYSRFMIKPREGSNPPGPTSENDHHWEDFNTWLLGRHRHCFSCWIKGDAGALTPERVVERIFRAVCSVDQSRLSLCDPVDCSPPGSSVHGISQGRTLEWAAIPSSRGPSRPGIKPGSLMPPALHACMLSRSVASDSVRPHRRQPTRLLHPRDSLGKNTRVGCHFLLHIQYGRGGRLSPPALQVILYHRAA